MMTARALVRRPSPNLDEGIRTHRQLEPIDYPLACRQWQVYVETLQAHGWVITEVPPAPSCPDGVFIEDTMVIFGSIAVIARPGAAPRTPEILDAEQTIADLNHSQPLKYAINRIRPPGTLDGGDVLKVGNTVYVGRGSRTNAAGVAQLRAILAPAGAAVVAVPISKVLHLKSAVTALPDGTVIGYEPLVDDPRLFNRFMAVPEESGAHVVLLGGASLLTAADCPESAALLTELGYDVVTVDISEFEKLDGCVTCLSVRLRPQLLS